ncbi:MAG TPA: sigma-54 dependent transcriptional regulator [Myxococcales bacterium]|nr:sigma-54 dependent transcriptional regulator [Myxococcales bacterium]
MDRILIVDDDRSIRELLSMHLEERGFGVVSAATGAEGFRMAAETAPAAIVLDMRLPDASGIDLIPELKKHAAEAPVLMITAHHDMATTILAIKAGAFDYIHKPIDIQAFDVALDRALEVRRLSKGTDYLSVEGGRAFKMDDIVGTSPTMQQLFKDVGRVAASRATVLIQGESGTGKELIARVIHSYSAPQKPFIAINCSAIVDTLLESELFGPEKGAFTGASQTKMGKFELAEDGSIFLDEIGELSQNLQAKLLRVLQEREVERVGGVRRISIKARILAATNRDLAEEVRAGRFREDLYQRLKVVTLRLPALRERVEDIPLLIEHLLVKVNQRLHKTLRRVPREVIQRLQKRAWPGNVRELENVLTRAAVLSQGDLLLEQHLVDENAAPRVEPSPPQAPSSGRVATLDEVERDHIVRVWALAKGHKGRTCQMLGISRPTLERKLKKYGIAGGTG